MNRLLVLLKKHNPFYLLSALSMLVGCYTLNHTLALRPGQTGKLLVLLATLNVYEGLLIGLALFLVLRRRQERDARILLVLEVLFLADATLLNGECFAADFAIGAFVSFVTMALAALKVAVVLQALDPRSSKRAASLGMPLVLLSATPGVFALLARFRLLTAATVYAGWWVVALTIVIQAWIERKQRAASGPPEAPVPAAFRRALMLGLPASLMLHLGANGWVYEIPFSLTYLGPILVAVGVSRMLLDLAWPNPSWRFKLPLAAILLSLPQPENLIVSGPGGLLISPLRSTLLAAALAYLLGYRLHQITAFARAAGVCLLAAVAGHSFTAIFGSGGRLLRWMTQGGGGFMPQTTEGWGILAVAVAFALLGLGAWASMLNGGDDPPKPPPPP